MRITGVKCFAIDATYQDMKEMPRNYTIVQVNTDEGITGFGDAGNWPVGASLPHIVTEIGKYILGEDPRDTEKLWQIMYRASNYVGLAGLAMTAISGIDTALWDIAGKALGIPVYRLLGGKCRDKIKVYANYWNRDLPFDHSAYSQAAVRTVKLGYDALKFYVIPPADKSNSFSRTISLSGLRKMVKMTAAVREAVGPEVEIYLECGGKLDEYTASRFMEMVKEYDIGFMEEPIPPENIEVMTRLTTMGKVPIASGERIYTAYGFRNLLTSHAVNIIQPDIARTGGITEMKKIASFAETYYVPVAPHNANSPLATAAAIHFAASTPNFMALEYLLKDVEWRDTFMTPAIEVKDSHISIPESPGLGVELDSAFIKKTAHTVSET